MNNVDYRELALTADEIVKRQVGSRTFVKCLSHNDNKPSAMAYADNVHCFVCQKSMSYKEYYERITGNYKEKTAEEVEQETPEFVRDYRKKHSITTGEVVFKHGFAGIKFDSGDGGEAVILENGVKTKISGLYKNAVTKANDENDYKSYVYVVEGPADADSLSNMFLPAVSFLGLPTVKQIEALVEEYEQVIIMMDNDKAGMRHRNKLRNIFKSKLTYASFPASMGKDPAEAITEHGIITITHI